jgi:hypothetical protein
MFDNQGFTKRCCLSGLTNSALVNETKCGVRGGVAESQSMSTAVHRSFGDLTPYLTYVSNPSFSLSTARKVGAVQGPVLVDLASAVSSVCTAVARQQPISQL